MKAFVCSDGGRSEAGFQGIAGDCVVRALCHVTRRPYGEVYQRCAWVNWCADGHWTARHGVPTDTKEFRAIAAEYGLRYVALAEDDITDFIFIRELSRTWDFAPRMIRMYDHATVLLNGVIIDSFDPDERWHVGSHHRMVYGWWEREGA